MCSTFTQYSVYVVSFFIVFFFRSSPPSRYSLFVSVLSLLNVVCALSMPRPNSLLLLSYFFDQFFVQMFVSFQSAQNIWRRPQASAINLHIYEDKNVFRNRIIRRAHEKDYYFLKWKCICAIFGENRIRSCMHVARPAERTFDQLWNCENVWIQRTIVDIWNDRLQCSSCTFVCWQSFYIKLHLM